MRHNLKKLLVGVTASLLVCAAMAATYITIKNSSLAWDAVPNDSTFNTVGYDIVVTQPSVTQDQLGTTNGIPQPNGYVSSVRVNSATLQVPISTLLVSNTPLGSYLFWARTVSNPVGQTNYFLSDWTNITGIVVNPPAPPSNLRITVP